MILGKQIAILYFLVVSAASLLRIPICSKLNNLKKGFLAFIFVLKMSRIEMTAVMLAQIEKRTYELTSLSDFKPPDTVYKINNHLIVFAPAQMNKPS